MKIVGRQIRLAGSDLSNHLACRHLTTLDLQVARGERTAPDRAAPDLKVIQELGLRHETVYLAHLAAQGLTVENLGHIEHREEQRLIAETLALMNRGADVIAQGALSDGEWFGRPDVLRRVEKACYRWKWSYEVADTKLARETKATTILQLSLYSELLAKIQGTMPEFLWVVPPGEGYAGEKYPVLEYAAYYRHVRKRLLKAVGEDAGKETYPEPVEHCNVCRWFRECDQRRRADDHLSLVAGIRRQQRDQFEEWNAETMAKLAALPIPLRERPKHGSKAGYEKVQEQARVQVEGRTEKRPVHEPILPVAEGMGFCRLPEPSVGDVFVDLEGDPFVGEKGLQYLFGFAVLDVPGELKYEKRWALNREEEKKGFEWLVDEIMRRREANPKMHVYHFGAYEPGALKRLMGMYATREDEIDRLLRAGVMVDLHQAYKQGVRASVEEYSLKTVEAFYGFERETPLEASRVAMRYVEHRLELGRMGEELPDEIREKIEGYNAEDCVSTARLRDWLEGEREKLVASGIEVRRLPEKSGDPSEKLKDKLDRMAKLTELLSTGIPADPAARTEEQAVRWLLAQLLSWHRREDKRAWQDGYRYAEMNDEDLLDERVGLTRMSFVERVESGRQVPTDRYSFEPQRSNVRAGKELYYGDEKFGEVVTIDQAKGVVDIKKTKKTVEVHPPAVYMWSAPLPTDSQAGALYRIGAWAAENGVDARGRYRAGRDLLLRRPPRLINGEKLQQLASETAVNTANRVVLALEDSVFAIQGPPGSGKTYTGARMICELVKLGKKIGVTALSHKVIRKLLDEVVEAVREEKVHRVRCLQKVKVRGADDDASEIEITTDDDAPLNALHSGTANVVGGTSWLWTRPDYSDAVDVLFIDEAGQMALADVVAVSRAAKNVVLIGDPQQLDRPLKGSHPPGAESSALQHLLGDHQTIPDSMGLLLPETWRLHPNICPFTSDVFYEGLLNARVFNRNRKLSGHPWLNGAGLWFVPVDHQANRNSSAEEIEVIARIVESLLRPDVKWSRSEGNLRRLTTNDILIVAPFNAQVADLTARMPDVQIGTVDKFQGQEAPVVIYSLTTSSPEDAPRGMEFLYSLNRLNVATSR